MSIPLCFCVQQQLIEKVVMNLKKEKDGVWEGSEGERGMGAMSNNIMISKCKINKLN